MSKANKKKDDRKEQTPPIFKFQGYYSFLGIQFPAWVYYQGFLFPSISTAFQAARTNDIVIRRRISEMKEQDEFKKIAGQIKNTPDWPQRRLQVMEKLNRDKFKRNKQLGLKLFATQKRELLNTYQKGGQAQMFWGAIQKEGQLHGLNNLGLILTTIRLQIQNNIDTQKWLLDQNVESDKNLWPDANIIIEQQDKEVDNYVLYQKNAFVLGNHQKCDIQLKHKSISKFHAAIFFSSNMELILIDLNSTNGTKIMRAQTEIKLEPLRPQSVENGDIIQFGHGLGRNTIYLSYEQVQQRMKLQQRQIGEQLIKIQKIRQFEKNDSKETNPVISTLKLAQQRNHLKSLLDLKEYSCLYVENVNRLFTYKDIKETFNLYGVVKNIRINIDQKTGRFMGSVLIYFQDKIKITTVLENMNKNPLTIPLRVVAVNNQEALKIIETFSNKEIQQKKRKQAEQNQKKIQQQSMIRKQKVNRDSRERVSNREKGRKNRLSSSSSSSSGSSSESSSSRSRSNRNKQQR